MSAKSLKSRVALLITNRNFTDERLTRKGAEKDEENMLNLLNSLQYEVVKHNDLTAKVFLSFLFSTTNVGKNHCFYKLMFRIQRFICYSDLSASL